MAWSRRATKRGGRRRIFRRRRGMRPTTEAGARYERCHFNFGVDQPISPIGDPISDAVQLIGGASMTTAMSAAGAEALAVARMLQKPLRDFQVVAVQYDLEAVIDNGLVTVGTFPAAQTVQCGHAIYTQRLDDQATPGPIALPPYWLSQWPVNQGVTGNDVFTEDLDYATRTHFHRAFTLAPHLSNQVSETGFVIVDGWPRFRFSNLVRIKRALPDQYALFAGFWNNSPFNTALFSTAVNWYMTGSLWYKMKF